MPRSPAFVRLPSYCVTLTPCSLCPITFYLDHCKQTPPSLPSAQSPRARVSGGVGPGSPLQVRKGRAVSACPGQRSHTSRGYSPANLGRSHRVAHAGRERAQTGLRPRASGGTSPHTGLTLSGVSLATPRRTQATQVTWRLRFMIFGLNPAQAAARVAGRYYELRGGKQRASAGARLTSFAGAKGKGRGPCVRWARPYANR